MLDVLAPRACNSFSRRAEVLGVCGLLLLFVALAALRAWDLPFPFYDDVAYLDTASRIHEAGGVPWLLHALFDGSWTEENRNPLYLGLLSIFAGRDLGFHLRAQILGIALGMLALLAAWWTARVRFGQLTALWFAALLACSETLIAWSAREACEPLLFLFAALAFAFLLQDAPKLRALFFAGVFSGLAQLCKGTGIFVAFAALLALGLQAIPRRSTTVDKVAPALPTRARILSTAALIGGVFTGGLPLFVRNLIRFGSPLHNHNDKFLWIDPLDDFSEVFAPGAMAKLDRGLLAYLHSLTPERALVRAGRGLGETLVHLGDSMSLVSPRPFGPVHIAWIVAGIVAAGFSLRLIWRAHRSFARTFLLVHTAFNFAFFAFYNAVSGSSRYLLPAALGLLLPLARFLASRVERREEELVSRKDAKTLSEDRGFGSGNAAPSTKIAISAMALAVLLAVALDPRTHAAPPGFAEVFEKVRATVSPGETFAIDSRSHLQPLWAMDPSVRMETLSASWDGKLLPSSALLAELKTRSVRWVLLDGTSRKDQEPRWLFADSLPLLPDGSLDLRAVPQGLRLVWQDPSAPHRYALLEMVAFDNHSR